MLPSCFQGSLPTWVRESFGEPWEVSLSWNKDFHFFILTAIKPKLCFCFHQVWPCELDPGNSPTGHFCVSPVDARGQVKHMTLFSSLFHALVEGIKTWLEVVGMDLEGGFPFSLGGSPGSAGNPLPFQHSGCHSRARARRWHDTRGQAAGKRLGLG